MNLLGIVLDINAMTVSVTPMFGMAMEFIAVSEAQENTLKQIIARATAEKASPAMPQAEGSQRQQQTFEITEGSGTDIAASGFYSAATTVGERLH
jgi:hypothetical protein